MRHSSSQKGQQAQAQVQKRMRGESLSALIPTPPPLLIATLPTVVAMRNDVQPSVASYYCIEGVILLYIVSLSNNSHYYYRVSLNAGRFGIQRRAKKTIYQLLPIANATIPSCNGSYRIRDVLYPSHWHVALSQNFRNLHRPSLAPSQAASQQYAHRDVRIGISCSCPLSSN